MTYEELIEEERKRQDIKWGIQDVHPGWWLLYIAEEVGELSQAITHTFGSGKEPNPTAKGNVLKELIQVGALAKAMYESGIRKGWLTEQGDQFPGVEFIKEYRKRRKG